MDLTCRCKLDYTCVACRVKRGEYKDWMCPICGKELSRYTWRCTRCYRLVKSA